MKRLASFVFLTLLTAPVALAQAVVAPPADSLTHAEQARRENARRILAEARATEQQQADQRVTLVVRSRPKASGGVTNPDLYTTEYAVPVRDEQAAATPASRQAARARKQALRADEKRVRQYRRAAHRQD